METDQIHLTSTLRTCARIFLRQNSPAGSSGFASECNSSSAPTPVPTTPTTIDESIYKQALTSGSVPINRYRVIVVGQDGAGKSCLIDSFLGRQFNARNPSTNGVAIHLARTAAEGTAGQHKWHEEEYEKAQHLDKYIAAKYVITQKQHQEIKRQTFSDASQFQSMEDKSRKSSSFEEELDRHIKEITEDEKLNSGQHEMIAEYLKSSKLLAGLENFEVSSKLLWDLGGQERYLTSHAALMPTESEYTVCMYLLVIDISKRLGDEATSSLRLEGTSADVPLELSSLLYNRDFPRHWFTSIGISHPSVTSSPYLGEDLEGVRYPAVLIIATHIDEVKKMPNPEDFLASQNAELDSLINDLKCEDHIVQNPENKQWFFRVDNTKSGCKQEERCKGVETIVSILDNSSKHYWSQINKPRPMPVAWVRFELFLVKWGMGKIISVRTATKLAYRIGIESKKEAVLALRFLHNLGVIFFFHDVAELANHVIVDPQWLINTVAKFVTAKEPVQTSFKRHWRKLCKTGRFSREMVLIMLKEAKVEPQDEVPVLNVLRMLDIICDEQEASSPAFLIPCMLSQKMKGSPEWVKYSPSKGFPPPIVIYPNEVQMIPEALFFRIVTRCARKFPEGCELTRNCCLFRIGHNLVLELLHYNRGACLIVSMTGEGSEKNADSSVADVAPAVRQFIVHGVKKAKERGMKGLEFEFYCQVAECDRKSETNCQLPHNDHLVKLPVNEPDGSVFCKSNKYCTEEQLERVRLWYKVQENCFSETQDSYSERLRENPTIEELSNLSDALAIKWKPIARRLKVRDDIIDQIDVNEKGVREKAYQVLLKWIEMRSEAATVEILCRALCKEGMQSAAADIFELGDEVLCRFCPESRSQRFLHCLFL